MRILILLATLLFIANPAYAGDIDGAFGLRLGAIFTGPFHEAGSLTDGTPMYAFTPSKPYRAFNQYLVTVTPKSHRITRIWAMGEQDSDPLCDSERSVLKSLLEKKYGGTFQKPLMSNNEMLSAGTRYINLKCEGFMPPIKIQIIYGDTKLAKLEETERVALEAAKVDAGGL